MSDRETYLKTSALASARTPTGRPYRGQKALVIKALLQSEKPLTAQEILDKMRALYSDTLIGGTTGFVMTEFRGGGENGLVGSIKFHLRQLLGNNFITSSGS
jgi:hypothetical protein